MPSVTVLGASASTVTVPFTTSQNIALAQQVANAISIANQSGADLASQDTTPPLPQGKFGEFVKTQPGMNVLPAGYRDVVNNASNAIIFGSGDSGERILSGTGNLSFFASAGSGTVVSGGGNNTINIKATDTGSWDIAADVGHNQIVDFGIGGDSIQAGAGNNLVELGGGNYTVSSIGNDTVVASNGAETVGVSGAFSDVVLGGSSRLDFVNGTGASTVLGQSGSDTVLAGAGGGLFRGGSAGANSLVGGLGAATLYAGGNNDTLVATSPGQALHAGAGTATLDGSASSGADTFFGGSGNATINWSAGSDVIAFINGSAGGTDVVGGGLTNAAQVTINLQGYGPNEAANAVAGQMPGANSVTIKLSDNTTVTFTGITHLTSSNFS